jgi:uncharacterized protein YbjT (DUF2867 family)
LLVAGGEQVAAVTRHPATSVLPAGALVVEGNPTRSQALMLAFSGVEAILISPRALGDATAGEATAELLMLAAERGVKRVVVLSALTVEHGGGYQRFADAFKAVEDAAKASGLQWTFLRSSDYASNALAWMPQIRQAGIVRGVYGDGATSTIHEHDVAAIAALTLLDTDAVHAGHSYVLTGPQSLSQRDKLRIIGEAIGRAVLWQEIAPEQFRQALLAQGVPADVPDRMIGYWGSLAEHPSPATFEVERLLGRPALTFADWASEHAAAFKN